MERDWLLYIAALATAFAVSLVMTPFAKRVSIALGGVAYPKKRGVKSEPIPQMGGVAIVLGFFAAVLVLMPFVPEMRTGQFAGFIVGALIIVFSGMIDDIFELRPKVKFALQIIAALVVGFSGTRINFVMWPGFTQLEPIGAPLTFLWILALINAVNFIDGLDGLAAGVSAIASICLMALCVISGDPFAVALSAALAGSCLGFLPRNFNPAELIMGDTGAMFLGYVLAVSSVIGVFKGYAILAVLIVFLSLALPIVNITFVTIKRRMRGQDFDTDRRGHLHYMLIDAGFSHKQAVVILYALSILSAVFAVVIAVQDIRALVIAGLFLLLMLLIVIVYRKRTH